VDDIRLGGAVKGSFRWEEDRRLWSAASRPLAGDPAWAVASVEVDVAGQTAVLADAVRFGGAPRPLKYEREEDGSVKLAWDLGAESIAEVRVQGPAGEISCSAADGGVRLPWWAVPAIGGTARIVATRERVAALADGMLAHITARISREVSLDGPAVGPARPSVPLWSRLPSAPRPPRRQRQVLG
jgi:hypothetical protein